MTFPSLSPIRPSDASPRSSLARARFGASAWKLRAAAVLTVLCLAVPAFAGGAMKFLETKQAELTSIVQQPKGAATDAKLQKAFDALLDYESIARNSLADSWEGATPEQRKEFTELLRTLVQRAYTKNIRQTLDYSIAFKKEDAAKKGKLVSTVATHKSDKRKEPIQIDYLLHQSGGKWQVYDIITEGSSLVKNYRNQFRRVIEKKGLDGLLERMRKKAKAG